ncbi:hypothetical protein DPMN_146200 [Dreissena polymorpha]|uniref:Uncharacterized protein n=1 Tax=Dreissena polymorpha TaxID=45954 RepID=A0A9D4F9V7_DREPO|nr:hypothetical protein DPMN_146200 [Dreissena polymorpha]
MSGPPRHGWPSPDPRSSCGVQYVQPTAAQMTLALPSVLWRRPMPGCWRVPVGPCCRNRLLLPVMAAICRTVVG